MSANEHEFVILLKGEMVTYTKYEDIPEVFDHVIKFLPSVPEDPHTEEQHEEIALWNDKLQELMQRERDNAGRV